MTSSPETSRRSDADFKTWRTCPLCEATCGLEIIYKNGKAVDVRGDKADVFSKGYLCPKGAALAELHNDPDRLRRPVIRKGDTFEEVSWDEAFALIEKKLLPLMETHGRDAVGVYLGNPNSHTLAGSLSLPVMLRALGTKNIFSSSTVDQMPKHVSSGLMFGGSRIIAVPDIDRTSHLIMLGANPLASNGSLATAPDFPGRLRAIKKRGGKIVVIDPKKTRTAKLADEHIAIRPGGDIFLLLAMAAVLFEEDLVDTGRLGDHLNGLEEIRSAVSAFSPEKVQEACGIAPDEIRRLTRELAAAPSAAVYGRMGISTVGFGTAANWIIDVLNILTGNLDRPGGVMFPQPAHSPLKKKAGGKGWTLGRWKSRVKGMPEIGSEFSSCTLCDEIETPGEGQIRAMLSVAGNPVIGLPNADRVDKALADLDFMVSVDFYINATTRHAHVILPPTGPLTTAHYDVAFYSLAVRNTAHYSRPDMPKPVDELDKWEILYKLAMLFSGFGVQADLSAMDDFVIETAVKSAAGKQGASLSDRTDEILGMLKQQTGPDRMLDFMIRTGAYGDGFGADPDGLNLEKIKEQVHGMDLGPLKPRVPEILATPSAKIELAPERLMNDIPRISSALAEIEIDGFLLIGRRHLRTNNSWLANIPSLLKGPDRCTLQVHPDDAEKLGVGEGEPVTIRSNSGELTAPVEISGTLRPGVVCFPHGWGHDLDRVSMSAAKAYDGINKNIITDDKDFDPVSGNAVLNGVPVQILPVSS